MLNLGNYIPSNEDFGDAIPSPLMDGDVPPAAPVAEYVEPVEGMPLPVEQSVVELPPELDPTPLQPLEAPIVQEAVIAENLDAEAGQLMGAQIALEGYGKLLRSSGSNMTRQSAAFMAIGMARANRLLGVTNIGLENESSGTQVMAMQKANVDKEGIGSKLKAAGAKVWEWLKAQYAKLKGLYTKLREALKPTKEQVVYLLAATEAVQSGNPAKVKGLPAPSGLSVSQVLDAIHGEDKRAPVQKSINLPAAIVPFVTKNGKLDLSMTAEHEFRSKGVIAFFADATQLINAVTSSLQGWSKETTGEEVADTISDLFKQHMGGKAAKWEIHGMSVERTAEGIIVTEQKEATDAVDVQLPSLDEIKKFLSDVKQVLDKDVEQGIAVAEKYQAAGENMMNVAEKLESKIGQEKAAELGQAMSRALNQGGTGSLDSGAIKALSWLDRINVRSVKACDFFLTHHLGKGNTVSQEDYLALPSSGAVAQPGLGSRMGSAVKQGWIKTKEFFTNLWKQFREWVARVWAKLFGGEKQTGMLLLMNEYVPENGAAVSGTPPALPPGTGLKSVAAARQLGGPSAAPAEAAPVEPEVVEPEVSNVPAGHVLVPSSVKLKLSNGYAFEPTIEETYVTWFQNQYNPALIKMWRDLISYVQSDFDATASDAWGKVIEGMGRKVMEGAPVGEFPGGTQLLLNSSSQGGICFSFDHGEKSEPEPIKALNKRQIQQALSRQKKVYKGLEQAQRVFEEINKLRDQFERATDKAIDSADDARADGIGKFYGTVNRFMGLNAVGQMGTMFASTFAARTEVLDAMIAARAKGKA
jgi:hypothetical protein